MRTIIDITDDQVKALDEISELEGTSRAALIRQAIDRMLVEDARRGEAAQAAFGVWSYAQKDGLEIEAGLRRGNVVESIPQMAPQPAPKKQVAKPPAPPEPEPMIEDAFVTTLQPEVEVAPAIIPMPEAPKPIQREASLSSVDPLSAFLAGVKS